MPINLLSQMSHYKRENLFYLYHIISFGVLGLTLVDVKWVRDKVCYEAPVWPCVWKRLWSVPESPVESFSGSRSKIIKRDKEESTYRPCNLMTHPETHTNTHMHVCTLTTHAKNSSAWVTMAQMQGRTVWELDVGHVDPRTTNKLQQSNLLAERHQ